ncbi:11678_t:CDS:2, partial [Dentiscutata erythropus]
QFLILAISICLSIVLELKIHSILDAATLRIMLLKVKSLNMKEFVRKILNVEPEVNIQLKVEEQY